jgi:hypothetical protein
METPMRYIVVIVGALALFGCGDDDDSGSNKDAGHEGHSGSGGSSMDGGTSGSGGSSARSGLERPGLPRPPGSGLPDELRPPR